MYQQISIVGNVGKGKELRYTQDGTPVYNFSVAVTEKWKQGGELREKTTWFKVSVWRGLAETCNNYIYTGMKVLVVGDIAARAYMGNDGEPKASLELTAQTVKFLSHKDQVQDESADDPF